MSNHSIVYFMRRSDDVGPVKIGSTTAPGRRLSYMMSWSPEPLSIVATTPGDVRKERQFHSLLASHRLHYEWFAPHAEVLSVVDDVAAGRFDFGRLSGMSDKPAAYWSDLPASHLKSLRLVRELNRLTRLHHVAHPKWVVRAKRDLFEARGDDQVRAMMLVSARIEELASLRLEAA